MADRSIIEQVAVDLLSAAMKLAPEIVTFLGGLKNTPDLPPVLRAAVDKIDPENVLDPYQQRIDAIGGGTQK